MPKLFPTAVSQNRIIVIKNRWNGEGQLALMTDSIVEQQTDGGTQCFPRYLYDPAVVSESSQGNLLVSNRPPGEQAPQDAITDGGLAHFQAAYRPETITKDDLFYYTYGILHSEDYRERYSDNLSKELPRIPAVKGIQNFRAFVQAGRALGDLHVGYETVDPYPVTIAQGDPQFANISDPETFYRVEQMKFAGKRPKLDKSCVHYNANITMTGIPVEAYDYIVNGKPAVEWVMERQCVKTDKASGIVNDANRYAIETVGDPTYPLMLFQRMITVSLETMKIVRSLPALDIKSSEEPAQSGAA
jgi:predicted helicase